MIDGVGGEFDKCIDVDDGGDVDKCIDGDDGGDVDVAKVFDLLGEEKLPCTLRSDSNGNMQVSSMIHGVAISNDHDDGNMSFSETTSSILLSPL